MYPWLNSIIALLVASTAAATDLRSGRIPNWLTFSTIPVGIGLRAVNNGAAGLFESLVAVVVCMAVPGVVYKASQGNGIGGGDIKLFAALGALLGPMQGLEVELSTFLLLGIYALFRLAFMGQLSPTLTRAFRMMAGLFLPKHIQAEERRGLEITVLRMGPAIAFAVLTVLSLPLLTRWLPWLG